MNVRLAAQTCSESVSVALKYMRDNLQLAQFKNVEGTSKFCSEVNQAFDILNSRKLYCADKSKEGISDKNIEKITDKIDKIIPYIKGLTNLSGNFMIHVRKNTGFIGLIISLRSVIGIYNNYYKKFNGFLLTYELS